VKITIEATEIITQINGQMYRVWRGVTEKGVPCDLAIRSIRVRDIADQSQFDQELKEIPAPEIMPLDFRHIW
jgi:hypothetical protein